jgi:hypothetical protein
VCGINGAQQSILTWVDCYDIKAAVSKVAAPPPWRRADIQCPTHNRGNSRPILLLLLLLLLLQLILSLQFLLVLYCFRGCFCCCIH